MTDTVYEGILRLTTVAAEHVQTAILSLSPAGYDSPQLYLCVCLFGAEISALAVKGYDVPHSV